MSTDVNCSSLAFRYYHGHALVFSQIRIFITSFSKGELAQRKQFPLLLSVYRAMSKGGTLPEEIVTNVLSRLPAKSPCQFMCVSRSWKSLISGSRFAETYLNRSITNNDSKIFYLSHSNHLYAVDYTDIIPIATKLDLALPTYSVLVGTCTGLVLLRCAYKKLLVSNPLTRESKELPESPFTGVYNECGFGYDSLTDDYKVVVLSSYGIGGDYEYEDHKDPITTLSVSIH